MFLFVACKLNIHKRCEKNVANNCGVNTKDMAEILQQLGISGDKLSQRKKKASISDGKPGLGCMAASGLPGITG